jgi:hypothetical protein
MIRTEELSKYVDTHEHFVHLISEHCQWLGIQPSAEPHVTEMYGSQKVNKAPVVPAVAVDYADDDYDDGDY